MRKNYMLIMLFFVAALSQAQSPGNVFGHTLWLYPQTFNDTVNLAKEKKPTEFTVNYFNFNPVLDLKKASETFFKNIVAENYSLFAVFKSDTDNKKDLIKVIRGQHTVTITNKDLTGEAEMAYKKIDSHKGIIVSFLASTGAKGKKNNGISFENFSEGEEEGKEQLIEVIFYPRLLSVTERQKVETYLSLKYGLSIAGDYNYLNSKGETIWNVKDNDYYNHRVTGIGRDDALYLYQKQSGNAVKDGIYIGLGTVDTTNAKNKNILKDNTFFLWGDNNKSLTFKNNTSEKISVMKRQWKMQLQGIQPYDSIPIQLRLNKKEMGLSAVEEGESVWLAINGSETETFNFGTAKYINQSAEDDTFLYFNDIIWDTDFSGSDIFTFVQGPDFFSELSETVNCNSNLPGTINSAIAGGTPPYSLTVASEESGYKAAKTISDKTYTFTDIPLGSYTVTINDSKGRSTISQLDIDPLSQSGIALAPEWYLDSSSQVSITPSVQEQAEDISYQWISNGQVISSDKTVIIMQPGNYQLLATNTNGCKKELPFTVIASNPEWSVYTNPVKRSSPFYIAFNLQKETKVSIRVSTMDGKIVFTKDLGVIKSYKYSDALITAGVYMITATIGNREESTKLIVTD